jgi:mono/diheme cytochrome c family protein
VLATILFLAFWVVLALGLVFVALRGGLRGARETLHAQSHGGRMAASTIFAIVYIGLGIALPIVLLTGNHARASAQYQGVKLTADEKRGRLLFFQNCGVCHTLAAASGAGKVGPNLDVLRPPASLVLRTIQNGCIQNPPSGSPQACLGYGTMPPTILQGKDAQTVADFVAKVAGR